ncbi:hypothetical protein LTR91_000934 [Friedmanniomyces endolithicus]|uniref:HMA domain-containing protein n=1 Tax=Friedmanniomyces endolithicus TaxID=329885 RepID=A0AAN6L3R4_9PEZI|nr:hypothetical protein LTR94_011679 [Friedmanniomyces endolithicus]KAK0771710.1 hypothetical protein LTR59_015964 [Friedmanniomyces endolithicus]KAK0791425.1 hypothetical protein LTR38_010200 [Friedmanniomyces endolithicus]KAK0810709.1 hypothetical protein LTR75_005437 [Friedmanniomyces endolithicus]KAK0889927.1 hypothetical protein LTR02_015083 [Friedmanniomyces endolithicus]
MCAKGDDKTTVSGTCKSPCGQVTACKAKKSCCEPNKGSAIDVSNNSSCSSRSGASEEHSSNVRRNDSDDFAGRPKKDIETGTDIEKGSSIVEHVSLSVGGLTCTGCETKLYKALHDIRGICNLHTSLVMSQAEFDIDGQAGPVDELIKTIEKATGFSCQRLSSSGQDLDLIVDCDAKTFIERRYLAGITLMSVLGKHEIRVTFDPKIIGARAVLEDAFGRKLRLAPLRAPADLENGRKHLRHTAWVTLMSAVLTIPVLVLAWAPLHSRPVVYGAISLALATAVQFLVAGQFYISALRALIFTRQMEMDLLIVLSTTTAYVCSIVAFAFEVRGEPLAIGEFFETSTLLVTFIMLGRLVSAFARQKAVETVSFRSLQRQTAVLCDKDGSNAQEIDARLLQYGDFFRVDPDSRITTDGVIVTGTTEVNAAMITGEALPVDKRPGSLVVAGSINVSGVIVVRLTNLPGDNTISTIEAMVNEAKFQKAKTQELVDIVASWFVPITLILAVMTFFVWIAVAIAVRHQGAGTSVVNAITYSVSVLIVSCPCAIGLCVPLVIVIGGGAAAKHGIIVKSATAFENGRNVSHVVFDKTGTLTEGKLHVEDEIILVPDEQLALSVTLGLTEISKHPVSAAVSAHLKARGVQAAALKDVRSITGRGIEGMWNGDQVRCGNSRWLSLEDLPDVQYLLSKGLTVFCVTIKHIPVCIFGLSDRIRPETHLVLAELRKRNIAISLVSGDDTPTTSQLAAHLNIPLTNVRSRCTPADKQNYLKTLPSGKHSRTLFCGDGTNDAVALAQADIGIHMSAGSEIARTAADVVLLRPSLNGILVLLDLSHAAMRRVYLNFAWSFLYNVVAILLAGGAFVRARIAPQYAGLGEIVSVLPVVLVAVQLRLFKKEYPSGLE